MKSKQKTLCVALGLGLSLSGAWAEGCVQEVLHESQHCADAPRVGDVCLLGEKCVRGDCGGKIAKISANGCYTEQSLVGISNLESACGGTSPSTGSTSTVVTTDSADDSSSETGEGSGQTSTVQTTGSTTTVVTTGSTVVSSSSTSSSVDTRECHAVETTDAECTDQTKPVCVDNTCKACGDKGTKLGCEDEGICGDGNVCVECLVDGDCKAGVKMSCTDQHVCVDCEASADCNDKTKPICDTDTKVCEGCTELDGECAGGAACNVQEGGGECWGEKVVWVGAGGATCSDTGTGLEQGSPLCTIAKAMSLYGATAGKGGGLTIRLLGAEVGGSRWEVGTGMKVAVLGTSGAGSDVVTVIGESNGDAEQVSVKAGGELVVSQVKWSGYKKDGVRCEGKLWMREVRLTGKKEGGQLDLGDRGIVGKGCEMELRRVGLFGHEVSGVELEGGEARMESTIIGLNGTGASTGGGLVVRGGASVEGVYVTVANNSRAGDGHNIGCTGTNTIKLRNSLIVGEGSESIGAGCQTGLTLEQVYHEDTATFEMNGGILPTSEEEKGMVQSNSFVDIATYDFRLNGAATVPMILKSAQVGATDGLDYEGMAHGAAGTTDYLGADQP